MVQLSVVDATSRDSEMEDTQTELQTEEQTQTQIQSTAERAEQRTAHGASCDQTNLSISRADDEGFGVGTHSRLERQSQRSGRSNRSLVCRHHEALKDHPG